MKFFDLLKLNIAVPSSTQQIDFVVEGLAYNSRRVKNNFIFLLSKVIRMMATSTSKVQLPTGRKL